MIPRALFVASVAVNSIHMHVSFRIISMAVLVTSFDFFVLIGRA